MLRCMKLANCAPLARFLSELRRRVLLIRSTVMGSPANQLWPEHTAATLFNDIAIALFVLDVFLVIVGWPPG